MLNLARPRKPILQQIFPVPRTIFGTRPVANRGELSYCWAINYEPGNSIDAPGARAHGLSLADRGRDRRVDWVICVSRVHLGDQADLRRNACARRQGGGVR